MESFLSASKRYKDYERIRVVLGNLTCDLDSAVCALVYGFLVYKEEDDKGSKNAVVPVLNIKRGEFRLKTEVTFYLKRCSINTELLTFRDEIDLRSLAEARKLDLTLVDHHVLGKEDAHLAASVKEVIDHRPKDPGWNWLKMIIEEVGSCATLVTDLILQRKPEILSIVSDLLRGPILVDTANFSPVTNRATAKDHEMMAKLEAASGSTDRAKLFQDLLEAKADISQLTPGDLLNKDLKFVDKLPIPGLPILTQDFLKMEGAVKALEDLADERGVPLLLVLGMDLRNSGALARDMAIYATEDYRGKSQFQLFINALTESTNPDLKLCKPEVESCKGIFIARYGQGNQQVSRKQIIPIVTSLFEKVQMF